MAEASLVTAVASEREPHVHDAMQCAQILRLRRVEREFGHVQRQIDELQRDGRIDDGRMNALLERKAALLQVMAGLKFSAA